METIAGLLRLRGGASTGAGRKDRTPSPLWLVQSAIPGSAWPTVPAPAAAAALALLYQLDRSQWLPAERLVELQRHQLDLVLRHAFSSVPFYRERWRGRYLHDVPLTTQRFARLPLLTRRDLQDHFEALTSRDMPGAHGAPEEQRTSGSTGTPVRFLATPFTGLFWNAFTLRDHNWQRRDLSGKLAAIRYGSQAAELENWGSATSGVVATGPAVGMRVDADVAQQLEWLEHQEPRYLLTYPSLVAELARMSLQRRVRLPGLLEVRTLGEALAPDVRALCQQAWGVPLTDVYSASETGYIALQCPSHEHYHVQSEGVLVEVLDDDGAPCAPGQVGRVVVTTLHNFAMPLVRYDIGDYAEPGPPCPCGRGLPVLRRILGRVRGTLVTADGRRHWPAIGQRQLVDIAPIRQHQFVQKAHDLVEAKLVTATPLVPDQEERLRQHILTRLPRGIRVRFTYCDSIPRNAAGKFEEFTSEVSAGATVP